MSAYVKLPPSMMFPSLSFTVKVIPAFSSALRSAPVRSLFSPNTFLTFRLPTSCVYVFVAVTEYVRPFSVTSTDVGLNVTPSNVYPSISGTFSLSVIVYVPSGKSSVVAVFPAPTVKVVVYGLFVSSLVIVKLNVLPTVILLEISLPFSSSTSLVTLILPTLRVFVNSASTPFSPISLPVIVAEEGLKVNFSPRELVTSLIV